MTDPVQTYVLLAAVATPLIGAVLVMLTGSRPNLREACSFAAAAIHLRDHCFAGTGGAGRQEIRTASVHPAARG